VEQWNYPSAAKIAVKQAKQGDAANCFEIITREWHKTDVAGKSEGHAKKRWIDLKQFLKRTIAISLN